MALALAVHKFLGREWSFVGQKKKIVVGQFSVRLRYMGLQSTQGPLVAHILQAIITQNRNSTTASSFCEENLLPLTKGFIESSRKRICVDMR